MSISSALVIARKYANGGRIKPAVFHGIPISIENKKGTIREGINSNGKLWSNKMAADYGYIKRTLGKDGDQVDVFVGPNKNSNKVFIIDQLHHSKVRFDEHKCLVGFDNRKQALTAYHKSYGRKYGAHHTVGAVTEMSLDAFKEWLKGGGGKKPVSPEVPKYKTGGAAKATKEAANYRLGTPAEHCGICTMFRAPDSCTSVLGKIRWMDNCDYFERSKPAKYQEGGGVKYTEPTEEDPTRYPYYESEPGPGDTPPQPIAPQPEQPPIMDVTGVGPVLTSVPETAKAIGRAAAEYVETPAELMKGPEQIEPRVKGQWDEIDEERQRLAHLEWAKKAREFSGETAGLLFGTSAPFVKPGMLGVAGGRPPGKSGPEAVHYWSQTIADTLTTKHGNDVQAIEAALDKIQQTASPRAATAVYAKLPEDVQFELAMRDMHPHLRGEGPEPRVPSAGTPPQVPAAAPPAFREITHPEEAKDWLRERGHSPEDMGFSDPESYVIKANELKRQEMGIEPRPSPAMPQPSPQARAWQEETQRLQREWEAAEAEEGLSGPRVTHVSDEDLLNQFFGQVSPSEVEHLPSDELLNIQSALSRVPDPHSYGDNNPELWNALHQRVDKINREQAATEDAAWEQLERMTAPARPAAPPEETPSPFQRSRGFSNFFNMHIAPATEWFYPANQATPETFANKFFAGLDTSKITADVWRNYRGNQLELAGPLLDKNGEHVGRIRRQINPEAGYAHHDYLKLADRYQGTDIAPTLLRNSVDLYRQMGLRNVEVYAALESGPYAWAKYGFIPTDRSWYDIRTTIRGLVERNHLKISDPTARRHVMDILNSEDPRSMWDLVDYKGLDDHGNVIGKVALLGNETRDAKNIHFDTNPWYGNLYLNDPASMERFNAWIKGRLQKKAPP